MFTSNKNDAFSMFCSCSGTCSPSIPALLKAQVQPPEFPDGPFHESLCIFGLAYMGHLKDSVTSGLLDGPHDF